MCIVVVTLTLLVAALVYRFVEVPSRNYFNKVFKTKQPQILVDAVEVWSEDDRRPKVTESPLITMI
jgi:peptidoglycan/LPS O-acetylase OafA/YrhL